MGKMVRLTATDGHKLGAYLAGPAPKRGGRAIVVIQEIFGINRHMRGVCDRFAAQGFTAIAPALFDRVKPGIALGYGPEDIEQGRNLRAQVGNDNAVRDMAAAAVHVAAASKTAVVGYCWGGSIAWLGATRLDFDAAVCYYGGQIVDYRYETPSCPVMFHFGDQDQSIPMKAVKLTQKAHPRQKCFVYKGAGHGFNCEDRSAYAPGAAAVALKRTLAFLKRRLA
ncbi:MAG: dienelactone hydrolase family protein [Proteobacteria bacterium]|nr:dienelactone hydrolase family protein [Pseudomonadota bacterium]